MVLVGCQPEGRYTEQHDVFFGIGASLKELVPHINAFWPEMQGKFHIDAWREVTQVNGYTVIVEKTNSDFKNENHLFFINLGGYKPGEFEEFHYKFLAIAPDSGKATAIAKQTVFYKTAGFTGAASHIDDKYTLDVDNIYDINELLLPSFKPFRLKISENAGEEDIMNLGYLSLSKLLEKE